MGNRDSRQIWTALATAGTVGFYLVAACAVGVIGGRITDTWLGIAPWGTVVGIVLGMIAGFWGVYKRICNNS